MRLLFGYICVDFVHRALRVSGSVHCDIGVAAGRYGQCMVRGNAYTAGYMLTEAGLGR